jgi:hypothetical protein
LGFFPGFDFQTLHPGFDHRQPSLAPFQLLSQFVATLPSFTIPTCPAKREHLHEPASVTGS